MISHQTPSQALRWLTGLRRSVLQMPLSLLVFAVAPLVHAGNTAGVFGPEVTPGSKALEARAAFAPSGNGFNDQFATRIHYQQSVSDDLRLRAVIQGNELAPANFDFDFAQFEAQWQFQEDEIHGWDSSLRLDWQIAKDRPDLVGLNWTSDIPLGQRWWVRTVVLTGVQYGNGRADGLLLQTRSSLRYRLERGLQLQLQTFSIHGFTSDLPSFSDQNHTIGPALSGKLAKKWSFEASALFGVTEQSPGTTLRFFLTRSL